MGLHYIGSRYGLGTPTSYPLVGESRASHISKFVEFYTVRGILQTYIPDITVQYLGWEGEVQYIVTNNNQRCYRDRTRNVVCTYLPLDWPSSRPPSNVGTGFGSGGKVPASWQGAGKNGRGRIKCDTTFSHFVDTCILKTQLTTLPSAAAYQAAEAVCSPAATVPPTSQIFVPKSYMVFEAARHFFIGKDNATDFWVGKYDELTKNMFVYETVSWADGGKEATGDCVVAEAAEGYKLKRTACSATALFLCQAATSSVTCPSGYSSVPGLSSTSCLRITNPITDNCQPGSVYPSISTAVKMCLTEGTSLAAPQTAGDITALATWAQLQKIPLTGDTTADSPFKAFIGLRHFLQALPEYAETKYYSPWHADINVTTGLAQSGSVAVSVDRTCLHLDTVNLLAHSDSNCLSARPATEVWRAVCEYRACTTIDDKACVFPFTLAGRKYDKCTTVGTASGGAAWCSTGVDASGVHVPGMEGQCRADCAQSSCPVGFWPQLGTCVQDSATHSADALASVEQAEQRCLDQGARLYQPRSTKSIQALIKRENRFYNSLVTAATRTILPIVETQETVLGAKVQLDELGGVTLWYRDGSQLPTGLVGSGTGWLGLQWATGFPKTDDPALTALNFVEQGKLGNSLPGNSTGLRPHLSYVCEARPFTTLDGDDPHKPCHFPFRATSNSSWSHSCVYDQDVLGRPIAWCATEVDREGVMVAGKKGLCEDERNTAYAGPGRSAE